jgi:hypothetical protein
MVGAALLTAPWGGELCTAGGAPLLAAPSAGELCVAGGALLLESPKQPASTDPKAANVMIAACARKFDLMVTGSSS